MNTLQYHKLEDFYYFFHWHENMIEIIFNILKFTWFSFNKECKNRSYFIFRRNCHKYVVYYHLKIEKINKQRIEISMTTIVLKVINCQVKILTCWTKEKNIFKAKDKRKSAVCWIVLALSRRHILLELVPMYYALQFDIYRTKLD